MLKAEEAALLAYPDTYTTYRREDDPEGIESGISPFPNTHILERKGFVRGYEQARKEMREEVASIKVKLWCDGYDDGRKRALTWQDIKTILKLADDLIRDDSITETEEEYFKAILDAFNKTRK